jgi:hypothetical protein
MPLITHVDRELLKHLDVTSISLSSIEAFGSQLDTLRWDLQQLEDSSLYTDADKLLKALATEVDDCMYDLRKTRDPSRLKTLDMKCKTFSERIAACTDRLGTDLWSMARERRAGTLHGVCVEFMSKVKKLWTSTSAEYRNELSIALKDSLEKLIQRKPNAKVARSASKPRDLSENTLEHIRTLAREDHRLREFLNEDPQGSEVYAYQTLELLRRFPHTYVRASTEYVVFNVNSSVVLVLNNWLVSTDAKLLEKLAIGEVPKVASIQRSPTVRWSYRQADIKPPLGYCVARVTFTSNARTSPEFFSLMEKYRAVQIGRNTWDIPIEPGTDTKNLRSELKAEFGYPAQVVELLTGPGSYPVKYNYMSRTAMPLYVIKPVSPVTRVMRSASTVNPWQVVDGASNLLSTAKKRSSAERIAKVMANAARKAVKISSKLKNVSPKSARSMERLARSHNDLIPVADNVRVVSRFLVADLRDFVSIHGLLVYQPQVGETVLHPRLGSVTVKATSSVPQMWLTVCTEDGQCHHITLPDLSGRQKIWTPEEDNDPLNAEGSEPSMCYLDSPDGAICVPSPMVCDDGDLDRLEFTTPVSEAINTFVPVDSDLSLDVVDDLRSKNKIDQRLADRIFKMLQAPSGSNCKDPLIRMVQETGANPAFHQPIDPDFLPETSSEEDDEFEAIRADPENYDPSMLGAPPFANAPRGPTPTVANLTIVQRSLDAYREISAELRRDVPVNRDALLKKMSALENVTSLLNPEEATTPLSTLQAVTFELKNGTGNVSSTLSKTIVAMLSDFDAGLEYLS